VSGQPPLDTLARGITRATRAEAAAVAGELRQGGDQAWNAPSACSGWAARDVVVHLVTGGRMFGGATRGALEGTPMAPPDPSRREALMAELRVRPREELLGELELGATEFCDYVDRLDAAALARPVQLPFATLPVWQVASARLSELALHHWDVRAPHTPDARLSPEAVPILARMVMGAIPILATGEKRDGVWQLDVEGERDGPVVLRVANGQLSVERTPAANPDVRLALDGDTLIRLFWGRLDLAQAIESGRVRVEGDHERALHLKALFPGR
jgi:uncharacterized protein (TIGR03083 family)